MVVATAAEAKAVERVGVVKVASQAVEERAEAGMEGVMAERLAGATMEAERVAAGMEVAKEGGARVEARAVEAMGAARAGAKGAVVTGAAMAASEVAACRAQSHRQRAGCGQCSLIEWMSLQTSPRPLHHPSGRKTAHLGSPACRPGSVGRWGYPKSRRVPSN
jgi:hypothetical protein